MQEVLNLKAKKRLTAAAQLFSCLFSVFMHTRRLKFKLVNKEQELSSPRAREILMKLYTKCAQFVLGLLIANTAVAQWSVPAGSSFDLGGGAIDLACLPVTVGGTYNLSNGQATSAGGLQIQAGGTFNAQGQLVLGAGFANQGAFNAGTGSVVMDGGLLERLFRSVGKPPSTTLRFLPLQDKHTFFRLERIFLSRER